MIADDWIINGFALFLIVWLGVLVGCVALEIYLRRRQRQRDAALVATIEEARRQVARAEQGKRFGARHAKGRAG